MKRKGVCQPAAQGAWRRLSAVEPGLAGFMLWLCLAWLGVGLLSGPLALGADYNPLPDTG